jgi:hypothetical protein
LFFSLLKYQNFAAMKLPFFLFLLLWLPAVAFGQPDSVKSPRLAVNAGFLMGGGAALGADGYQTPLQNFAFF